MLIEWLLFARVVWGSDTTKQHQQLFARSCPQGFMYFSHLSLQTTLGGKRAHLFFREPLNN